MKIKSEKKTYEFTINDHFDLIEQMLLVVFNRLFEQKKHTCGHLINFEGIASSLDSFYESHVARYEFSCRHDEDLTEQQRRGLEILIADLRQYYLSLKKELLSNGHLEKENIEDITIVVDDPSIGG